MKYSKSFFTIFSIFVLFHYYLLASVQTPTPLEVASTSKPTKMKVSKVVLKKEHQKKIEPKKVKKKKKHKKKKKIKPKKTTKPQPIKEPELVEEIVQKEPIEEPIKEEKVVQEEVKEIIEQQAQLDAQMIEALRDEYLYKVRSLIQKHKFYPKRAKRFKQTGEVYVSFKINRDGSFGDVMIIQPSRYKILNRAALEIFENIIRFDAIPKELKHKDVWDIKIPIAYKIT